MATSRRIARLESLIQARIAEILHREVKDPRLGFITIQRVHLDREITLAKVYWSIMGDEAERRTNERVLDAAKSFIQREVAAVMPTRNSPRLEFLFDESIEGAIRIEQILKDVLPPQAPGASTDADAGQDAESTASDDVDRPE